MSDWRRKVELSARYKSIEESKNRSLQEKINNERNLSRENIAIEKNNLQEKLESEKSRIKELEIREKEIQRIEDNNNKINVAEIDRKKELEKIKVSHSSELKLNEQNLLHGLIIRNDELEKEITLRNGEYNFELKKAREYYLAEYKKNLMIQEKETQRAHIKSYTDIRVSEIKDAGETTRTRLIEESKLKLQKEENRYKAWEVQELHRNAVELEYVKSDIYIRNLKAETKEISKRNFDETVNYMIRKGFDIKCEIMIMRKKERIIKETNNMTDLEIENFIRKNSKTWID